LPWKTGFTGAEAHYSVYMLFLRKHPAKEKIKHLQVSLRFLDCYELTIGRFCLVVQPSFCASSYVLLNCRKMAAASWPSHGRQASAAELAVSGFLSCRGPARTELLHNIRIVCSSGTDVGSRRFPSFNTCDYDGAFFDGYAV
jgi:hypothetical protein